MWGPKKKFIIYKKQNKKEITTKKIPKNKQICTRK